MSRAKRRCPARTVACSAEIPKEPQAVFFLAKAVQGVCHLYALIHCAFSLGLAATGADLVTAFGVAAARSNGMGVGLGETAAGFGGLNDAAT
ncbi:MAG: hypothetical protein V9H25_12435 [Candidatus Competibacter sp.]